VLPDARSVQSTRALIRTFLPMHGDRVLLCTVIKDLSAVTRDRCKAHI
jgi:hypothetical protein